MDLATIDLLIVLGMIVVVTAIGVRGYRVSGSITGYFLAGRGLGPWVLAFSIMPRPSLQVGRLTFTTLASVHGSQLGT
jgi:uncharacterized sodium:solute symporter family permease YidK